jgi:hypothetical protein
MLNPLKRYYEPLGSVMVNFNMLENDLKFALWRLSGINEQHAADMVIGHVQSFDRCIRMFRQLANRRFKDKRTLGRIDSLAKRLRKVNTERNDLVHGKWVSFGVSATIIRFQDQKEQASWRTVSASPKKIRDDAIRIIRLQKALRKFIASKIC